MVLRKSSLVLLSLAEGQQKNTEGNKTLWNPQIQERISSGKVGLKSPCSDFGMVRGKLHIIIKLKSFELSLRL